MDPPQTPTDWDGTLKKQGFSFSDSTPGMAVDMNTLDESVHMVDGLEYRVADENDSVQVWSNVFAKGYGLPLEWEPLTFKVWNNLGFDLPIRNYIGYLHGKPVSTSCLFLGGGAAGIYSVATLPEARGKGIGAAMTVKPLLDAYKMGYRIGVLQSSEMGFNIYKRIGFRHLCQIEYFYRQ